MTNKKADGVGDDVGQAGLSDGDHVLFDVVSFAMDLHQTVSWKGRDAERKLEVWVPREV